MKRITVPKAVPYSHNQVYLEMQYDKQDPSLRGEIQIIYGGLEISHKDKKFRKIYYYIEATQTPLRTNDKFGYPDMIYVFSQEDLDWFNSRIAEFGVQVDFNDNKELLETGVPCL